MLSLSRGSGLPAAVGRWSVMLAGVSLLAVACGSGSPLAVEREPTVPAASAPGSQTGQPDPVELSPTRPETAQPMNDRQIQALYQAWSRPIKSGSKIRVDRSSTLPVAVPEGGITVSAYIPASRSSRSRLLSRELPAGTPREQTQKVLDEFEAIPGAVVDWSPPAQPDSTKPNDSFWGPDDLDRPGMAIPFSRIGLCCAPKGMVDGWDIASTNAPLGSVNLAIVDSGLLTSQLVEDELRRRFIGGWDATNTGNGSDVVAGKSYGAGKTWDNFEKSQDPDDKHGTDVAAYAVAETDNLIGIAGAAGKLPTVKFGMFRSEPYSNKSLGIGKTSESLAVIKGQVDDYIEDHQQGYKWNVVNNSGGNVRSDKTAAALLIELAYQGVLVISSAGNKRNGGEGAYGRNPIIFPAANPAVIGVAAWGSVPLSEGKYDYQAMYKDETAVFSSISPFMDIAAPGTALPRISILNPDPRNYGNGTSFSAPIIAGIASTLISLSGDRYQCPDKITPLERFTCVEKLRAALVGASNDITGPNETPHTQGAGVIDAPAAYLGTPALQVPAGPKLSAIADDTKAARDGFTIKLNWSSADGWADGSKRGLDDPSRYQTTYRLAVDGDPTWEVAPIELDPSRAPEQGADNAAGSWVVPGTWSRYRIPNPPILPAASGKNSLKVLITLAPGETTTLAVTEIVTYLDSNGNPRRQVESMPSTISCSRNPDIRCWDFRLSLDS